MGDDTLPVSNTVIVTANLRLESANAMRLITTADERDVTPVTPFGKESTCLSAHTDAEAEGTATVNQVPSPCTNRRPFVDSAYGAVQLPFVFDVGTGNTGPEELNVNTELVPSSATTTDPSGDTEKLCVKNADVVVE